MLNKVILIGRLGKDPEVSYTQSGTARCRFSLVTSEKYYEKGGDQLKEVVQWHNVVVWGRQAESSGKYLGKGSLVVIEGSVEYRSWDDSNTGEKKYMTEIKAVKVIFMPKSGRSQDSQGRGAQRGEESGQGHDGPPAGDNPGDDDIPF